MSLTPSSRISTPPVNALNSFTKGDGVERTLNDWKSWRAVLAAAVQGYVSACADLTTICASLPHQPHQKGGIETALLAVDAELTSLASEEAVLRNARASLTAARNLSATLSPIHTLPPEIFANIFLMVEYGSAGLPAAQLLAGVSSYWRQVAIGTPSLWTCIDITTTQTNFDYATLSLDRSNNCLIDLTIFEPKEDEYIDPSWKAIDKLSAFLIQASQHIRTVDIKSYEYRPGAINMAMKLWLSHGSAGATKTLRARALHFELEALHLDLPSAGLAGEILRSVSVLQLQNTTIPWTSTVYHNLVDLRLWFSGLGETSIPVSRLATILSSSLGLVTLKIRGLTVTPSDGWDATTVVQLMFLEVLYLGDLSPKSCELLLPLIPLSNCTNDLTIGLHFLESPGIARLNLMRDFLRGAPTRTLVCCGAEGPTSPTWALSLAEVVPSLEHLVLYWLGRLQTNELRDMALEHQPSGAEDEFHNRIAPCLPRLSVVSGYASLEGLSAIISRYGVQTIYLERCYAYNQRGVCQIDGDGIRARLTETFPNLVCVVSDIDTSSEWPCSIAFIC